MDKNQKVLLLLMKWVLQNETFGHNSKLNYNFEPDYHLKDLDWHYIFEEAKAHEIHMLLYSFLAKLDIDNPQYKKVMLEWKDKVALSTYFLVRHEQQIKHILLTFQENCIPAIPLKGLVLRNYYPQPEHRTMLDADILIKEHDMERAKAILSKMGYLVKYVRPKHIHFIHKMHKPFELHSRLTDRTLLTKDTAKFEENVWKNTVPASICGVQLPVLSPEDMLLYLLLHMAYHAVDTGLGLQQLADIYFFLSHNRNNLNEDLFRVKIKECGLEKFTQVIFNLCNYLFDMHPALYKYEALYDDGIHDNMEKYQSLIDDLLVGGNYGKRDKVRYVASPKISNRGIKRNLLFPKNLGERYMYAINNPVLTPIAWVHRIIHMILRNDYTVNEKIRLVISSSSTYKKRLRLLRWLDLE